MRRICQIVCFVLLLALMGSGVALSVRPVTPPPKETLLSDLKKVNVTDLGEHTKDVGNACFSRDGRLVATGCYDGKVRVFDLATGKILHAFEFGDDGDNSPDKLGVRTQGLQEGVAFDHEGKRLVAVGGWFDPPVALATVFDLTTKKPLFTSRSHYGMVHGGAFSGDGSLVITAGHDSTLKVLDAATGKEQGTFKGHDWVVTAVTFSPDGKSVASVCCNTKKRSIRVWDPVTLKESQNIPLPDRITSLNDLRFSPDGKQIAGVSNWRLHVWEVATGKSLVNAEMDAGLFKRLAYSPDGKRIAVAGGQGGGDGKGILRVYDFATDKVQLVFVEAEVGKESLAISWPVAEKILLIGARGKSAKLAVVELNK